MIGFLTTNFGVLAFGVYQANNSELNLHFKNGTK